MNAEEQARDKKHCVALVNEALAGIGQSLKEKGITFEEMLESIREIRGEMFKERTGIESSNKY